MIKKTIKKFLPPIFMHYYRNWRTDKIFKNIYKNFNEVGGENFWNQKEWLKYSKFKLDNISSTKKQPGHYMFIFTTANLLSKNNITRILDFGGGTGFVFFGIQAYLSYPKNIMWHVVDNEQLSLLGKNRKHKDDQIEFFNQIPEEKHGEYEIIYINTVLQYLDDYALILKKLVSLQPSFFVFTKFYSGNMESFITSQKILNKFVPCRFISILEFVEVMSNFGHNLIVNDQILDGSFQYLNFKKIPKNLIDDIGFYNLIFQLK